MKKVTIFYHRVDFDGIFSCLIANNWYRDENYYVSLEGYNYGDKLPDPKQLKIITDEVVILDVTFPPEVMMKLVETFEDNLTWIDHHLTAINDSVRFEYSDKIKGIREINNKGACELTWLWYYPQKMPKIIEYISANDVWDKGRLPWNDVMAVQSGLRAELGVSLDNILEIGNQIWDEGYLENTILPIGRNIMKYLKRNWRTQVKNSAFEITVAGKLKGLALLSPDFSSAVFESVVDRNYQVFCICNIKSDNPGVFNVGMYSEPDGRLGNFELGKYMKQNYNGGGHKCAAGGVLSAEQFRKLVIERII